MLKTRHRISTRSRRPQDTLTIREVNDRLTPHQRAAFWLIQAGILEVLSAGEMNCRLVKASVEDLERFLASRRQFGRA